MAEMRIAVFGDSESIKGFAAVGFDIYPFDDIETAAKNFRSVASGGDYAVIYVTEDMFSSLEKEIRRTEENMLPAVVPIPGVHRTGIGVKRLGHFVEQAVGSDIIFNN